MKALGLIEVNGYLAAIEAADAALKAANVSLISIETVKAGICTVEITGDVGAVKASVEAGAASAEALGLLRTVSVIPRLHEETLKILLNTIGKVKAPYSKSDGNYLSLQTSVEDKTPSQVVNNSIEDDSLNTIGKVKAPYSKSDGNYLSLQTSVEAKTPSQVVNNSMEDDAINTFRKGDSPFFKNEDNYLNSENIVEDKFPSEVVNKSIQDDGLNIIEKVNSQDDLSNKKMNVLEGEVLNDSNIVVSEKESNRTKQDYSSINVEELRRMVRKLKLPNITNKEIKFAKKDLLIKILLEGDK